MATPPPDLYNIQTTHKLFFISSLLLIGASVWMMWDDYDREWKHVQRDYNRFEYVNLQREVAAEAKRVQAAEEKVGLERALAEAREDRRRRGATIRNAEDAWVEAKGRFAIADSAAKAVKGDYDSIRYYRDEALHQWEEMKHRNPPPSDGELRKAQQRFKDFDDQLTGLENKLRELREKADRAEAVMNGAKAKLDAERALSDAAAAKVAAVERDLRVLQKRLPLVDASNPIYQFRNAVGVDFINPTITVKQVLLPHIQDDYNFAKVGKVDRCHSCHLTIDNPRYEAKLTTIKRMEKGADGKEKEVEDTAWRFTDPNLQSVAEEAFPDRAHRESMVKVLRAHPRLDLYLLDSSPHPLGGAGGFGCTVCHQGDGRSLTFSTAAHTPDSDEQAAGWKAVYDWHPMHHWDYPMLARHTLHSACYQCHQAQAEIAGADRWQEGRRVFERVGCFGCHKTENFELRSPERPDGARKVGPALEHIADKVTPAWAYHWIMNPKEFRPTTRMPRIFGLSNMQEPEFATAEAEVGAVVQYLFHVSRPLGGYEDPPGAGDPKKGEELVRSRGCLACHRLDSPADDKPIERLIRLDAFGPSLAGIGSKTAHKWVYNWVLHPKRYFPDTKMPDLRLTKEEAADAAAFLMTLKNPDFEKKAATVPDPDKDSKTLPTEDGRTSDKLLREQLVDLAQESLKAKYPPFQVKDEWRGMLEREVWDAAKRRDNVAASPAGLIARLPKKEDRDAAQAALQAALDTLSFKDAPETYAARVDAIEKALSGYFPGGGAAALHKACDDLRGALAASHKALEPLTPTQWIQMYVGERTILRQGCFGCHDNIPGFEKAVPIGVELSGKQAIGSKDILKFDFGYADIAHSREGWLLAKLRDPRQFDHGRRKTREEKLRMPMFGFTEEEAQAVVVFLSGLTNVEHAPGVPKALSAVESDIEKGRRIVAARNCRACHVFQVERVTYEAEVDGRKFPVTLNGWVTADDDDQTEEKEDRFVQLWRDELRIGKKANEKVAVPYDKTLRYQPFEGGMVMERLALDWMNANGKSPANAADRAEARLNVRFMAPPVLQGQGGKTQAEWLFQFLKAPYIVRPWLTYRMPTFGFTDEEAAALVKYFYALNAADRATTRDGFVVSGRKTQQGEEQVRIQVARGEDVDVKTSMVSKLDAEDPSPLRAFPELEADYVTRLLAERPKHLAATKAALFSIEHDDLRCKNCHIVGEYRPNQPLEKLGPDLERVRERLRPDWIRRWLRDPNRIYPGTNMPTFQWGSGAHTKSFPDFYPGDAEAQIDAVKDFLMNRLRDVPPLAPASGSEK